MPSENTRQIEFQNYSLRHLKEAISSKDFVRADAILEYLSSNESMSIPLALAAIQLCLLKNDLDRALLIIAQAEKVSDENYTLSMYKASIRMRKGEIAEAVGIYAYNYERNPNDPNLVSNYVTALARLGRFDDALDVLNIFEKNNDEHHRVIYAKIDMFVRLNDHASARHYFERYRNRFPSTLEIELLYIRTLIALSDFESVESGLDRLEANAPENPKIATVRRIAKIEKARRSTTVAHVQEILSCKPVTESDYVIRGDLFLEFKSAMQALKEYELGLAAFPNSATIKGRKIEALLRDGLYVDAGIQWGDLLETQSYHSTLMRLLEVAQAYASSESLRFQISRTEALISRNQGNRKNLRRVALVGGSNTIMRRGWAPMFSRLMERLYGAKVENFGLGGISSLYGLAVLKEKILVRDFDIIIFEYTLNDVYFNEIGAYSVEKISSVAKEIARILGSTSDTGPKCILLEMVPLSQIYDAVRNKCKVANVYRAECGNKTLYVSTSNILNQAGLSECFVRGVYTDNMHFTSMFAREVAIHVAEALYQDRVPPVPPAREQIQSNHDLSNLRFVRANELFTSGSYPRIRRKTNIIEDDFIVIPKSGKVSFALKAGETLLGILINSSIKTGYIKVIFGELSFIKNIYAQRPSADSEKPRIFLRQFSRELFANTDLTVSISPDVSPHELTHLPEDITAYPAMSSCALQEQELEIAAVLIA